MYNISISDKIDGVQISNGYVIIIGCKVFVTTDIKSSLRKIEKYIDNPDEVEAEFAIKYPTTLPSVAVLSGQQIRPHTHSTYPPNIIAYPSNTPV